MHHKYEKTTTQNELKQLKKQVWLPLMTSGLEKERVYPQRKGKVKLLLMKIS